MHPGFLSGGRPAPDRSIVARLFASFLPAASLVGLFASVAQAGEVRGIVTDPEGRPVAAARVAVVGLLGARTVQSGADGRFDIPNLPAGTYRVMAEAPGLHGATEPTPIADDEVRTLDVTLALSPVAESVVVSAAQVETPLENVIGTVTVITGEQLRERQVESFTDALRTVPGLTVSRSGGRGALTSMFPRGGESDYTLVLVDGVRVNAFGGGVDLSLLDVGNVARIEFVPGPQSALYGADAIGGVVQVITRQGGRSVADGLVEGGRGASSTGPDHRWPPRAAASASGSAGAFTWGGSVERGTSKGFTGVAPASGERVSKDDNWHRQLSSTLGWHTVSGATIGGSVRSFDNERGFPGPYGSNPIGAFPGVDRISRGRNHDRQAGLSAVTPLGRVLDGRIRLRLSSTYSDLRSEFESPFGPSVFQTRRFSARAQSDIAISATGSVSGGVEAHRERARSTYITGPSFEEVPIERTDVGYFGELRQQIGSRLALTAGMRVEQLHRNALEPDPNTFAPRPAFTSDSQLSPNPRAGVVYALRRDRSGSAVTRVHASAGTGIRPPDAFEIAYTDNPRLKPERSRSIEAGLSHVFPRLAADVHLTAFRNDYDDLIVAVGRAFQDASRFRTDNISNARAQGLEIGAAWRSAWGLSARAAYTWLDTAILDVDGAGAAPPPFSAGDPLVRRPRHQGSLGLTYVRSRVTGFLDVGGRGRALDIEPNYGAFGGLFTVPGFTVVDAGGAVRVHRAFEVFARGTNLLDRAYEETLGFPALGRTGMVGVRVAVGR
jgi:outer membrane cobalamin receptor